MWGYCRQTEVELEHFSNFEWQTCFKYKYIHVQVNTVYIHGTDSEPERNPHRRGKGCKPPTAVVRRKVRHYRDSLRKE